MNYVIGYLSDNRVIVPYSSSGDVRFGYEHWKVLAEIKEKFPSRDWQVFKLVPAEAKICEC